MRQGITREITEAQPSPAYTLTNEAANCSACGWQTGTELHYKAAWGHHCSTCHTVGNDWHRKSDSERPTEGA